MSYPMPAKQFTILDCRYWHIEGTPLFVDMDKHM
jgi:hypothetical protein